MRLRARHYATGELLDVVTGGGRIVALEVPAGEPDLSAGWVAPKYPSYSSRRRSHMPTTSVFGSFGSMRKSMTPVLSSTWRTGFARPSRTAADSCASRLSARGPPAASR